MVRRPADLRDEVSLEQIFQSEIKAINTRRAKLGRDELPEDIGQGDDRDVVDAVGLALSGGGIRSAAFSLGVLQALNQHDVFRSIDYLSTVSGGGYVGASLTATMTVTQGDFVFGRNASADEAAPPASDIKDTDAVGHVRNYSNYLIPFGARDLLTGAAIVIRGLVANVALVFPVLLLAAAVTVWANDERSDLRQANIGDLSFASYVPLENFGVTVACALVGFFLFLAWALYRSFLAPARLSEFRTQLPRWAVAYLVFVAIVFFCEIQPFVIVGMFDALDAGGESPFFDALASWIQGIAAILAPFAAVVTFFRQQFGQLADAAKGSGRLAAKFAGVAASAAIWLAGMTLPLLIWVLYLHLSYWGIANDKISTTTVAAECPQGAIEGSVALNSPAVAFSSDFEGSLQIGESEECSTGSTVVGAAGNSSEQLGGDETHAHAPGWLVSASSWFGAAGGKAFALLYALFGIGLFVVSWFLTPNANSLHRLYRDRLSKAFLFDPQHRLAETVRRNVASISQGRDFRPIDQMKISDLSVEDAPYHLVNAALNIQGSDFANRRGRNADFFMFSPKYVGSEATQYAATGELERASPDLDLATAMAISGAAASSNMGANSIRPLTPTLALLNIRLGYWLTNPRYAASGSMGGRMTDFYLWSEITGRLYENSNKVYVTDGGHIDNLGIYELLRRQCRLIVVVDAEADPEMHFPSFIRLQQFARIDLGVRIDLPWDPIGEKTRAWMGTGARAKSDANEKREEACCGPHIAIGQIAYGGGKTGFILYVKSSLTGDENDYIRDYARRSRTFPHETTGDQFFSEEQFEVYRALGFHAIFGFLKGGDDTDVVVSTKVPPPESDGEEDASTGGQPAGYERWAIKKANDPALAPIRRMLGLAAS